ncbi:MAG: hypothetical protein J7K72_03125 [Candidatus Aenigmarchaeota archaeon]|nr:hypothetical protein [Candidatus Aenigmarchaeota archaeon]
MENNMLSKLKKYLCVMLIAGVLALPVSAYSQQTKDDAKKKRELHRKLEELYNPEQNLKTELHVAVGPSYEMARDLGFNNGAGVYGGFFARHSFIGVRARGRYSNIKKIRQDEKQADEGGAWGSDLDVMFFPVPEVYGEVGLSYHGYTSKWSDTGKKWAKKSLTPKLGFGVRRPREWRVEFEYYFPGNSENKCKVYVVEWELKMAEINRIDIGLLNRLIINNFLQQEKREIGAGYNICLEIKYNVH